MLPFRGHGPTLPTNQGDRLTQRAIARFWAPLAATWLMMAAEGPFLAALIARTAEAKLNLAAFGVALSLAMLIEAPVVMLLSASTALARDRASFRSLRRFVYVLCGLVTFAMLLLLVPPIFRLIAEGAIGLSHEVADRTAVALGVFIPWPGAIGYRRFYQGVMIRSGQTRRVALGTVVRLTAMAIGGVFLYFVGRVPGAVVGAGALSFGVVLEAAASRILAAGAVRALRRGEAGVPLSQREILRFYAPLAATSLLAFGLNPLVTFFIGHSRMALESLAVMPVIGGLLFLFRAPGIAVQEVGVALLGEAQGRLESLARFARSLAVVLSAGLALIAFTPAASIWLRTVSGLTVPLAALATPPVRILFLMPALEVLLALQRSVLVNVGATTSITAATTIEVATVALVVAAGVFGFGLVGAVAAACAFVAGRLAACLFLLGPTRLFDRRPAAV